MAKTKIEYVDYTLNPVRGLCPMACPYCYARRLYKRFGWNPEIAYMPPHELAQVLNKIRKPSRIFVGSTMELFGEWVDPVYREFLLGAVANYPQHTFLFLTKKPENLPKEWPGNCWVGMSVTSDGYLAEALTHLSSVKAPVKFLSFEPLLQSSVIRYWDFPRMGVSWAIIGRQTPASKKAAPQVSWIREIVDAADKAGVPVFEKNNLKPILGEILRQEFPQ